MNKFEQVTSLDHLYRGEGQGWTKDRHQKKFNTGETGSPSKRTDILPKSFFLKKCPDYLAENGLLVWKVLLQTKIIQM